MSDIIIRLQDLRLKERDLLRRVDSYFDLLSEEGYLNPGGRELWQDIRSVLAQDNEGR
jgi:hypothetical protein